jgi:2-succinyl-5-enolpyruvyl-6-hydroxy-3-cyclohexene-1-carboxylate synthase
VVDDLFRSFTAFQLFLRFEFSFLFFATKQPAEILRSLKQYVKVMQKDRLHIVDRYNHLRDTDPAEAESLRPKMAEHLRMVDQQMTIALNHLNRVPRYQKKIQLQISK